jgi:mono/diheme cytochrome c family protein
MSTSWKVILKRLGIVAIVALVLLGVVELFAYDVIKIQFVSFMGLSPAMQQMEHPLPVATESIPIEGPAFIPNLGAPKNPVPADQTSLARGSELFQLNCAVCHGSGGKGDGTVSHYLQNKPADLTSPAVQFLSDGAVFMTITNGIQGYMPSLNENLTVRERWDVVNFVRTLSASSSATATPAATSSTSATPTATAAAPAASSSSGSSSSSEPEATEEVARPSNPGGPGDAIHLTGDPKSGAQVFASNCQTCHAAEGKGGNPNPGSGDGTIPALNPIDPTIANADPKTFAYNIDLFVQHGSTPEGTNPTFLMPAWGDKNALTQQQIADVIAYIISLNPVK